VTDTVVDRVGVLRYSRAMEYLSLLGGYPALFVTSLAASSILPVGSEWLLVLLLANGSHPVMTVAVASAGNILGACTTYWVGRTGGEWLSRRFSIPPDRRRRAESLFGRFGSWVLLFSWLPVIGDPLCLVAGGLRLGAARFVILTGIGKVVRYAVVAMMTLKGVPLVESVV